MLGRETDSMADANHRGDPVKHLPVARHLELRQQAWQLALGDFLFHVLMILTWYRCSTPIAILLAEGIDFC